MGGGIDDGCPWWVSDYAVLIRPTGLVAGLREVSDYAVLIRPTGAGGWVAGDVGYAVLIRPTVGLMWQQGGHGACRPDQRSVIRHTSCISPTIKPNPIVPF